MRSCPDDLRLVLCLGLVLSTHVSFAQGVTEYSEVTDERLTNPEPENWLMFRRTYDGWGYSPLDEINTRNVDELVPVWTVSTGITEGHQSPHHRPSAGLADTAGFLRRHFSPSA